MPFDWMRVSFDGLLHFMASDFENFFDYTTRRPVPDSKMVMYRSHLHSFWHDVPDSDEVKEKYRRRINRFNELGQRGKQLVFVRSIVCAQEIARADELLSALRSRFGESACLVLISDWQKEFSGPFMVEGHEDLLVYFQEGKGVQAPYVQAVEFALKWVSGDPVETQCVSDLENLSSLMDDTFSIGQFEGDFASFEKSAPASFQLKRQDTPATRDLNIKSNGSANGSQTGSPQASLPPVVEELDSQGTTTTDGSLASTTNGESQDEATTNGESQDEARCVAVSKDVALVPSGRGLCYGGLAKMFGMVLVCLKPKPRESAETLCTASR